MRFRIVAEASSASSPLLPNEDCYGFGPKGVWVVDGASTLATVPIEGRPPAAWYAHALSAALQHTCQEASDAVTILREALRLVALRYEELGLRADSGTPPSASVGLAVIRGGGIVQTAVLGDIAIGHIHSSEDQSIYWLHTSTRSEIESIYDAQTAQAIASGASAAEATAKVMHRIESRRKEAMNRRGGYWIASTDPSAADHATMKEREAQPGDRIFLASDGFMAAERYGIFPDAPTRLATSHDLRDLIRRIRDAEASDPALSAYPRVKASDDATAVAVELY